MGTKQGERRIRLTRKSVEDMFDECNKLYFNNMVERPIRFETWTTHKKTVGMVRPVWSAKKKAVHASLHISRRYKWNEGNLRHVVVHEMIHLAIGDYKRPLNFIQRLPVIGRFFIKEHDGQFVALMNELNDKYNLGITVRAKHMRKYYIR